LRKEWIWWLLDWCDTWPFEKKGECIHSTSRKSFLQELKKCQSAQNLQSNTHKLKKEKQPWASVGKNERKPCSYTEWLTEVWARAVCELERRWKPEMDRDWTTGDLCSMHKGLAEFLNDEERIGNKCVKCRECRNGMNCMNTLDYKDLH